MTVRCKVCNTSKIANDVEGESTEIWECKICGNVLDVNGFVIVSEK